MKFVHIADVHLDIPFKTIYKRKYDRRSIDKWGFK